MTDELGAEENRPRIRIERTKSLGERYRERYEEGDTPRARYGVDWYDVTDRMRAELGRELDGAEDERPIQRYFERHPQLLSLLLRGGHGRWIIPELRLGGEYRVDFAMCVQHSSGTNWTLIELENPNKRVLRTAGDQQTADYTHALQQVNDWRAWLRDNVAYARSQLDLPGIDADFDAIIVMGRRQHIEPEHTNRYRQLSGPRLEVMSYDRLLSMIAGAIPWHEAERAKSRS